ncbi:MAG: amidohydrolase family protein [Planctomycetes bacterium]|nr:amidohydrolase family protein [Planctomycetota bacterium]
MKSSPGKLLLLGCGVLLVTMLGDALLASDNPERVTVIRASRVITGTGEILTPGEVVIDEGKISLVGAQLEIPDNARIIDARGQTLMAGMILARTRHGLKGLTRNGTYCDWSPMTQLVEDEMPWQEFLECGFVAAALVPSGSGFPGHSVVVHTSPESTDRVIKEGAYLPLNGVSSTSLHSTIARSFASARGEIEKVDKAREKWEKEQEEAKKKSEEEAKKGEGEKKEDGKKEEPKEFKPPEMNPALVPLVEILQEKEEALPIIFDVRTPGLVLHFDEAMSSVKEFKERDPFSIFILPGASNGAFHEVVERLGERGATVLIPPRLSALPDTYIRFSVPVALSRAGCTIVSLPINDDFTSMRALPRMLSELVRFGLSEEDAIASVTLNPARLLGLGDRMGTVEAGKEPHFVLFDTHPLAPGARVMKTIIDGEVVWDREDR